MMRSRRVHRTGQVFLTNQHIAEIEAEHAIGKTVLEIGPGPGMLTRALLKKAKKVIAVEKDRMLYNSLAASIKSKKLKLINKDFLDISDEDLGPGQIDIMIANIPYQLSSNVIEWLSKKRMQAVLCLQKEFVNHMLAKEDTREYSRLSVITALSFRVTKILDVPRGNFRPIPLVDSSIIYIKPLGTAIDGKAMSVISALMQHKKKTIRSAMIDGRGSFGKTKDEMSRIMETISMKDQRVFKLRPNQLSELSTEIASRI